MSRCCHADKIQVGVGVTIKSNAKDIVISRGVGPQRHGQKSIKNFFRQFFIAGSQKLMNAKGGRVNIVSPSSHIIVSSTRFDRDTSSRGNETSFKSETRYLGYNRCCKWKRFLLTTVSTYFLLDKWCYITNGVVATAELISEPIENRDDARSDNHFYSYQEDEEDNDYFYKMANQIPYDLHTARPQLRHYNDYSTGIGSILIKSIQLPVAKSSSSRKNPNNNNNIKSGNGIGGYKKRRRLVAYDFMPILPPYDTLLDDLVLMFPSDEEEDQPEFETISEKVDRDDGEKVSSHDDDSLGNSSQNGEADQEKDLKEMIDAKIEVEDEEMINAKKEVGDEEMINAYKEVEDDQTRASIAEEVYDAKINNRKQDISPQSSIEEVLNEKTIEDNIPDPSQELAKNDDDIDDIIDPQTVEKELVKNGDLLVGEEETDTDANHIVDKITNENDNRDNTDCQYSDDTCIGVTSSLPNSESDNKDEDISLTAENNESAFVGKETFEEKDKKSDKTSEEIDIEKGEEEKQTENVAQDLNLPYIPPGEGEANIDSSEFVLDTSSEEVSAEVIGPGTDEHDLGVELNRVINDDYSLPLEEKQRETLVVTHESDNDNIRAVTNEVISEEPNTIPFGTEIKNDYAKKNETISSLEEVELDAREDTVVLKKNADFDTHTDSISPSINDTFELNNEVGSSVASGENESVGDRNSDIIEERKENIVDKAEESAGLLKTEIKNMDDNGEKLLKKDEYQDSIGDSEISTSNEDYSEEEDFVEIPSQNLNSPRRPRQADPSINEQFVRGLDDLDKFFEEVDPPEELDPGAYGISMQDLIMGQGTQIIKTRVKRGIQQVKTSVSNIRGKATNEWRKIVKKKVDENEYETSGGNEGREVRIKEQQGPLGFAIVEIEKNKKRLKKARKAIWKVVGNIVLQIRELLDDLGLPGGSNDDDDDSDEDGYIKYDQLKIADEDLAEMRRKVMERRTEQRRMSRAGDMDEKDTSSTAGVQIPDDIHNKVRDRYRAKMAEKSE